ncbi:MAG: hypothetical protein FWF63_07435 [Fibromonadales bacterium]|nr:hypothetical protein [Fibromonadales bacterium]
MDNQMTVGGFLNFCIENAKRHFLKFLGLYVVAIIVLIVGAAISSAFSLLYKVSSMLGQVGAYLSGIILLFLLASVSFGFLKNILNLCRGEKVDFMVFIKVNPITILYFFIHTILISIILTIGYILFIIPGVILTLMLLPAPFLVIDRDMGPISAIKESFRITSGHKMDLFVGLCVSITVAVYLSTPIISLVFTIPMMLLIYVYPYLLLTGQLDEAKKHLEANT